jgi:hypothetical protein
MTGLESDTRRAKYSQFHVNFRTRVRPLRQLKDEYRSDRGGNRQQPLRNACDEVDLVGHVHSPLIEMDLTVSSLHRQPMHNKCST